MKPKETIILLFEQSKSFPSKFSRDKGGNQEQLKGLEWLEISKPQRPDYVHKDIAFFIESNKFDEGEIFTGLLNSKIYFNVFIGDWKGKDGEKSTIGVINRKNGTIKLIVLRGYMPTSRKRRERAILKAMKKKHPIGNNSNKVF